MADRAYIAKCMVVVDAHGDLSPTGRAIIENARAWIAAG